MRLDRDVQRLLTTHGYDLSLKRTNNGGSYNTATGKVSGGTASIATVRGVFIDYRESDIDGTSILADDRKLLLQARGLTITPKTGDVLAFGNGDQFADFLVLGGDTFVTADGETYQVVGADDIVYDVSIVDVRKIQSGSTVVAYICQTRG